MPDKKRFDPEPEAEEPEEASRSYGTSPMQIDEHTGPDQTESGFADVQPTHSAYGGAEYKGDKRKDTLYNDNPELGHPDSTQHPTHESGEGYSSGAGQQGEGYQGDEQDDR